MKLRKLAQIGLLNTLLAAGVALSPDAASALGSDTCAGAVDITSLPFSDTSSTATFTVAGTDPTSCTGSQNFRTFWYKFIPVATGVYTIDTFFSNQDTYLRVYKTTTASCNSLPSVYSCDNNSGQYYGGYSYDAVVGIWAELGDAYLIQVSTIGNFTTDVNLRVNKGHETGIAPIKNLKLTIPAGATSVTKTIKAKVYNADADEPSGHGVVVGASDDSFGGCSIATVTTPDFSSDPGVQNPVTLAGGKSGKVALNITINAADVSTPNPKSPGRCRLYLDVYGEDLAGFEYNGDDNETWVLIDVLDQNDF